MDGTVKVPGFGNVKKKTATWGAVGAGVFVIAAYIYRKRKGSPAAPAAGGTGTVTDPAGNACAAVNPATGYCPGTAEDLAASQGTAGYGTPYDTSGLGVGLSGAYYGTGGAVQPTAPGPGNFADNAEWAQYVEAYMTGTLNADPAAAGNAIGKYITGQPVTADQQGYISEAIAYGGYPPVSGPNGDPPGINTSGSTGGTGGGTGGGGTAPAGRLTAPAGIRKTLDNKTSVRLEWSPVHGATGYVAQLKRGGSNGTVVNGPFDVGISLANFGGLTSHTHYTALIWPSDSSDPGGPGSNQPHTEFAFTTS